MATYPIQNKQPTTQLNNTKNIRINQDPCGAFRNEIIRLLNIDPGAIDADGALHRFSTNGKRGDDAGWYAFHLDGIPSGAFGDWRAGIESTWCDKSRDIMTVSERQNHDAWIKAAQQARDEAKREEHAHAAAKAISDWNSAKPADTNHPYLAKKGIQANGARQSGDNLLVPIFINDAMASMQTISPGGDKRFAPGGQVAGGYYTIGSTDGAEMLLIAEGFATAASLYEATGIATICAFNAGNLPRVAEAMRKQHPVAEILICGDDDFRTEGNPGRSEALKAAAICGGVAAFPTFSSEQRGTDFNDLSQSEGHSAVKAIVEAAIQPKWFQPITSDEWGAARLSPDCIVEGYLYADVALLIAPGGAGKTTLLLYEAIHIVLGLPLYGKDVARRGTVAILTAEDGRDMLIARLNRIATAMNLTDEQMAIVQRDILIQYVGNSPFRLTEIQQDVVVLSPMADALVARLKPVKPVLVVVDPAVSFGVGESRVNDAEQGLVMAARRIRDAINCCVRFVHHTGKVNAREKTTDQYSGRGGSAFADGARMVTVLSSFNHGDDGTDGKEWMKLTGEPLGSDCSGLRLNVAKLSYEPPRRPIYLERNGYSYREISAKVKGISAADIDSRVLKFIADEWGNGARYSQAALERSERLDLPRDGLRASLARLQADGKLITEKGRGRAYALKPQSIISAEDGDAYREATSGW